MSDHPPAPNAEFSVGLHGLKLIFSEADNCTRFLIYQPALLSRTQFDILLASGTEANERAAMAAAKRAAIRIEWILAERQKAVAHH
jgi:hypothetical protein